MKRGPKQQSMKALPDRKINNSWSADLDLWIWMKTLSSFNPPKNGNIGLRLWPVPATFSVVSWFIPYRKDRNLCFQNWLETNCALLHSAEIAFSLIILWKDHHNFKWKGRRDCEECSQNVGSDKRKSYRDYTWVLLLFNITLFTLFYVGWWKSGHSCFKLYALCDKC